MQSTAVIDYSLFPHIVEAIVTHSDYKTKLRLRATCRALRRFTDSLLLRGLADVDRVEEQVDHNHPVHWNRLIYLRARRRPFRASRKTG